jgi:hypothetical protein
MDAEHIVHGEGFHPISEVESSETDRTHTRPVVQGLSGQEKAKLLNRWRIVMLNTFPRISSTAW